LRDGSSNMHPASVRVQPASPPDVRQGSALPVTLF